MNNKKTLLVIVLAFLVLMVGASVLYNQLGEGMSMDRLAVQETQSPAPSGTPDTTEPPRIPAPDFTVYDAEGNEVRLSDYIGKPVVVNFWASWCGPCKMEMPDFDATYQELGEEVQFLMVNLTDGSQETLESASKFVDSQGYTFPVYYDSALSAAMTYGVNAVPITYFLDAEGNLVAHGQGALTAESLQRGIDMIH
jgi:thiol-disulfide isomerase/thioredoxin